MMEFPGTNGSVNAHLRSAVYIYAVYIVGTYVFTHIRFHAQYITAGYFENVTLYYVIAFCLFTLRMTLSNCDKICEKFSLEW